MKPTPGVKIAAAALTFTLSVAPALAQKKSPPAGGPAKAFTLPASESYRLPNGLQVTLVPYGNIPKVSLDLFLRTGNLNDPPGQRGISDLTGELLTEGTTTLDSKALAEATARMGSNLGILVGGDETSLDLDVLSEFSADAANLLADVVEHPLLPQSEIARVKSNMLRQITVAKSQPGQIAQARFRKLLYGAHPYGSTLPSDEEMQRFSAFTIEDVKNFYAANFGAARAHLYVAGRFDSAALKKAIAASFGAWAKGSPVVESVPHPQAAPVLDVTDRPGAPQSTLYVGLSVPDATSPEAIPLLVTNALLGGSFGSRITSNIREQKGYTYSPRSEISRRYHDAYWAEVADVTTAATGPSLKEIFGEIERLQKEAPSAQELEGIQNYLSGLFLIQNSSRSALVAQLRFVDLQGLGPDYLRTYVQKVNAVTPADVQKITAQYIRPEQMIIVVVGDKAKITDQLAPYAPRK